MPPIQIHNPENSTRFYIQKLIKRNRAYRKRKLKHEKTFIEGKRPRPLRLRNHFDDHDYSPEP